jgi:hypothetical protein
MTEVARLRDNGASASKLYGRWMKPPQRDRKFKSLAAKEGAEIAVSAPSPCVRSRPPPASYPIF